MPVHVLLAIENCPGFTPVSVGAPVNTSSGPGLLTVTVFVAEDPTGVGVNVYGEAGFMSTVGSIVACALCTTSIKPARTVNSAAIRRRGVMELLESGGRRVVAAAAGDHGAKHRESDEQEHDGDGQSGDHGPLAEAGGRRAGCGLRPEVGRDGRDRRNVCQRLRVMFRRRTRCRRDHRLRGSLRLRVVIRRLLVDAPAAASWTWTCSSSCCWRSCCSNSSSSCCPNRPSRCWAAGWSSSHPIRRRSRPPSRRSIRCRRVGEVGVAERCRRVPETPQRAARRLRAEQSDVSEPPCSPCLPPFPPGYGGIGVPRQEYWCQRSAETRLRSDRGRGGTRAPRCAAPAPPDPLSRRPPERDPRRGS